MTSLPLIARVNVQRASACAAEISPRKAGMIRPRELERLQAELRDTAAELDRHGRHDAADLAVTVAARLGELVDAARTDRVDGAEVVS